MAAAWSPPPNLTVSQWADEYRKLSPESSAEPGQWRTGRAPYQRGMMDAVNDPSIETIVIMSSAQIGKTELINNVVGFYASHDPAPILCLQPTLEMALTWSKDRLAPMVRDTPALKFKVKGTRSRDSGNTLLHKVFPGGHITMSGANSAASLASRPIRILLCDEVDRYPPSAGTEGDPVSLGRKRTATFWNRKIILTSTPTIKDASRIEYEFDLSDQRRYYVPCPECDESQTLKWSNIVYDKDDPEDVSYACDNGCVIDEAKKLWMLERGEWVAESESKRRAGFHLNELYSPWRKWREVVADFIESKGNRETLKTWVNTSLGESWEEKGDGIEFEGMMERCEAYDKDSLPDDILLITSVVDVQHDRFECLSQGWGVDKERWNIEHKIIHGDTAKPDTWAMLDDWLLTNYSVAGRRMMAACSLIDSGDGARTEDVYNFCKGKAGRRIYPVKGSSKYYEPIASRPIKAGRQRVTLFHCGTDTAKDSIIFSSLQMEEPGPGYIHFPHTVDLEFFKQLTAETRKTKMYRGKKRLTWVKIRERNEVIDLHVYNLCAYAVLSPDIKALQKRREPVEVVEPEQRRTTQKARPIRKRKNWVTDF